jgi:hypothetical protein
MNNHLRRVAIVLMAMSVLLLMVCEGALAVGIAVQSTHNIGLLHQLEEEGLLRAGSSAGQSDAIKHLIKLRAIQPWANVISLGLLGQCVVMGLLVWQVRSHAHGSRNSHSKK